MKRTAVTANNHALREMLRNSGDTRIQTSGYRNTALRGGVAGTDHCNACPCSPVAIASDAPTAYNFGFGAVGVVCVRSEILRVHRQ
jgi:hypothetical protein